MPNQMPAIFDMYRKAFFESFHPGYCCGTSSEDNLSTLELLLLFMRPRYLHCPPSLLGPSNYLVLCLPGFCCWSPFSYPFLPESAGEGVLIPTYGIPYAQCTIHTGVTTRLPVDTRVSANINALRASPLHRPNTKPIEVAGHSTS